MTRPQCPDAPPLGEPLFLTRGASAAARTLGADFVQFTLTLAFYALCCSVGRVAFLLENRFGADTFERFVRAVESVDEGGSR